MNKDDISPELERAIKNLIYPNMVETKCTVEGYDLQTMIQHGIGFRVVCYKKEEANKDVIIDALYKQILKHDLYPAELISMRPLK